MTDPLSISAGILAILDMTERVIKYGLDVKNAIKDRDTLKKELESFQTLLRRLLERCSTGQPNEPWLRGLFEPAEKVFDRNGVWVQKHKGVLAQLALVVEDMAAELIPDDRYKKYDTYQRLAWHWTKDKLNEMLTNITRYYGMISIFLNLKNDQTATETFEFVKLTSEHTNLQMTMLNDRLSGMQDNDRIRTENERRRMQEKQLKKEATERRDIAAWLSPLKFRSRQEELFAECFKATGGWLLEDSAFKEWTQGRPWHLRCYGEPGVGKTVLSSILLHHLDNKPEHRGLPVLSLFLDYKESNVQTLPNLFGSLLKQLIQFEELYPIPDQLRKLYQKATLLELQPRSYSEEIRTILSAELDRYERFYIIVDGLDEYPSRDRMTLLNKLKSLQARKLSLVVTSRPISGEPRVPGYFKCDRCETTDLKIYYRCKICYKGDYDLCQDCKRKGLSCLDASHNLSEPYRQVEVDVIIPNEDIERYVRWEIGVSSEDNDGASRDERSNPEPLDTTPFQDLCRDNPDQPERIVSQVVEKASGRFLFARLHIDALKMVSNLRQLQKTLKNFPDNLESIYQQAMQRIHTQENNLMTLGCKILGLVTCARRTLSLKELQHALSVEASGNDEVTSEGDIHLGIEPRKRILDCTCGLVTIDNEGHEVRLVHRSLEDFLKLEENRAKWFPRADSEIAQACITYLTLVVPSKPKPDAYFNSKKVEFPFLQYVSQYWGDHVRDASSEPDVQAAALQIINSPQHLAACMQAAWVTDTGGHDSWDIRERVDRLHVCAWYGLSFAISALEPEPRHVDVTESKYGQTPLMYACRKGHVDTTSKLLDLGASLGRVSTRGRTPMFEAIAGNHDKIVKLLVDRRPSSLDINATHNKEYNRTALILTANLGRYQMAEVLLQHPDIDVNVQDSFGMTAIAAASRAGCTRIVELLLIRPETKVDIVDFDAGRSALRCAAERNFADVVELLLRNGAQPNLVDRQGGTAMLRAVYRGCQEALMAMIDFGVDLHCVDEDSQSLLHSASRNGHFEIARLLVENGISPQVRDKDDLTPLHDASRCGETKVIHTLLDLGADKTRKDNFGRTPHDVAWQYGQSEIMDILGNNLESQPDGISHNLREEKDLPLWSLARLGRTDVLTDAIKTRKQDLLITEPGSDNTALHCAIQANNADILEILLETHTIPIDQPNHYHRTPLHLASLLGHLSAVQLLISHGANLNLQDRWNSTALILAQSNRHIPIMTALVEAKATIDTQKIDVQKLFFFVVEQGNVKAAKILLENGADRSTQNQDGVRAMQIAEAGKDMEMVFLLRSSRTVRFDMSAVGEKDEEVVEYQGLGLGKVESGSSHSVPFRPLPMLEGAEMDSPPPPVYTPF